MPRQSLIACLVFVAFGFAGTGFAQTPGESVTAASKPVITRKDDLPRHSYQLDIDVVDLYLPENRAALLGLADEVEADILADLGSYDIQDDKTVEEFYGVLANIAILEERWQDYLALLARQRELEPKEANRLTMGLYGEALAKARLGRAIPVQRCKKISSRPCRAWTTKWCRTT